MKYKYNGEWVDVNIKALDSMVIGSIIQFVGTTIPTGWLECDGSTITQSAYPELYDLIGGTLPDFRGRVLVGQDTNDTDFDTIGKTGGSKELQAHTHKTTVNNAGTSQAFDRSIALYNATDLSYALYTAEGEAAIYPTGTTGTGNSGNLQPYAVVKHIIKATNTTPTMASVVNATNSSTTDAYSCKYVNNLIKHTTVTGTTDSNGFVSSNLFTNNAIVLNAIYNSSSSISSGMIIPYIDGGRWTFKNANYNYNAQSNVSVSLEVYYIEI